MPVIVNIQMLNRYKENSNWGVPGTYFLNVSQCKNCLIGNEVLRPVCLN